MASRLRSRCLALGLITSLTSSALAQPAEGAGAATDPSHASSSSVDQAKAHYERGAQAYAAGRFKDAIDLFLQADELAPSAALSFNIARGYEKIGDDAASLQWYRDFRRRAPDAPNALEVERRIEQLEGVLAAKGLQQLTVFSTPTGATVVVDGQPVGVTPFTGQLPPGKHQLTLRLKGYSETEQVVELGAEHARDLTVPLSLAPAQAASQPSTGQANGASDRDSGPRFGVWPYVVLGAGAASLAGALGFELARRSAEDSAKQDSTQIGYHDKLDKMEQHQTTARILAIAGGALVLTGGTLLLLDLTRPRSTSPTQAKLGWACGVDGCAMDMRGSF
jgi:tetratricopeptide (TPR) repeat protein